MTEVFDLSDPANPVKIRDFGLVGQEPGATGTVPTDLHGPISAGERNRIYFGYGTNKAAWCRSSTAKADQGTEGADRREPALSEVVRDRATAVITGAHTAVPCSACRWPNSPRTRTARCATLSILVNEQILNECQEPRQMVYFMDVTIEQWPMGVSNFNVPETSRQPLRPRRPLRRAFVEREQAPSIPQEDGVLHLVQCRSARGRHPRSLSSERDGYFIRPSPRRPTSAASRSTARIAARSRSSRQQRRDTTTAATIYEVSPRQHRPCTSWS